MNDPGWRTDPTAERWWDGRGWTELIGTAGTIRAVGPVADPEGNPPAGWYPDPTAERWWDGDGWTEATRSDGTPVPDLGASAAATVAMPVLSGGAAGPSGAVASTKRSSHRTLLKVAAIVGILGVLAAGAVVVTSRGSGESDVSADRGGSAGLEPPVGAVPASTSDGVLATVTADPVELSAKSCSGLRAVVDADECVQIEDGDTEHLLVLHQDETRAEATVYVIKTTDESLVARPVLQGSIAAAGLPEGTTASLRAGVIGSATGPSLFLTSETSESDGETTSAIEFIQPVESVPVVRAVVTGSLNGIGADDGRIRVAVEDEADPDAVELTTLYPVSPEWMVVAELFDSTDSSARAIDDGTTRITDAVVIDGPTPSTTTTLPPPPPPASAVPAPPPPQLPADDGTTLVYGDRLICDGSWISIVASRTRSGVSAALADNPGADAVRNASACASLNPRFTSGSNAGQDIYVVFYGPFYDRYTAQDECILRGKYTMNECYVAPLTNNPGDQSIRFGPDD